VPPVTSRTLDTFNRLVNRRSKRRTSNTCANEDRVYASNKIQQQQQQTQEKKPMADHMQGRKAFKAFNQEFVVGDRYHVTKELGQGAYGIVW